MRQRRGRWHWLGIGAIGAALGLLPAGSQTQERPRAANGVAAHAAIWLSGERWLIAGGTTGHGSSDRVEIVGVDGRTSITSMSSPRAAHTATVLPNGVVLLSGGVAAGRPLDTLETLDPATGAAAPLSVRLPVAVAEHAATVIADGRVLVTGGQGAGAVPIATVQAVDLRNGHVVELVDLVEPRAGHTATLLTDGRVLIAGGHGPRGILRSAEAWDGQNLVSATLTHQLTSARTGHTATLLPGGDVLIAGGVGPSGRPLATIERFDPQTGAFRAEPTTLQTARAHHTATLLPTGELLVWGGADRSGALLATGEIFDPRTGTSRIVTTPRGSMTADRTAPALGASLPDDGARDVPSTLSVALRFSEPLAAASVTTGTVTLTGPVGPVAIGVVPAESGLLAFVTPTSPLEAGTTYQLELRGVLDTAGWPLAATRLTFTTAARGGAVGGGGAGSSDPRSPDSPTPGPVDERDRDRGRGDDQDDAPGTDARSLPPLVAGAGVTAVSGRALQLDGSALAHVTLEIGNRTAKTDRTGRFLLEEVPPGHREMVIDGRSASRAGRTYGVFEVGLEITAGRTNILPYTIWMPEIDTANAVTIPSPTTTETVITSPRIPGLEVRIPAGSVLYDHERRVVRQVSLTEIAVDRPPFPLATHVVTPVYFTLQPGGGYLRNLERAGARVIYPNRRGAPAGTSFEFWHYDPGDKDWYVYGQGKVTADGKQIVPEPGVGVYEFTGAMVAPSGLGPLLAAIVNGLRAGDPVDVATGLFVMEKTDLASPDTLPLGLTRTYRQNDSRSRPFGIGATHPYEIFLVGDMNPYTFIDLILPDGGRVHFARTSAGTGFVDAVYEHTATPTAFYGAKIVWNPAGLNWYLTLRDGTRYSFPEGSGATTPQQVAVTEIRDRFGNTLQFTRDGTSKDLLKVTSPGGRSIQFVYDEAHRIIQAIDQLGRTVSYAYDASGRLVKVTDPAGGVTEYTYDASHRMLTVKDARGITYLTHAYDSSGRVITQTQADGTTYQYAYTVDVNNAITQTDVTDPRGLVRRVTFNSQGYVVTDTRAVGRPEQQVTTYTRQAGTNLVQAVTDALGRQTSFTYDAKGNVTSVTRLAGTGQAVPTSLTWEAPSPTTFNRLTSVTTPLPTTTTWTYDDANRRITVTDPLGHTSVITHSTAGQPVSITNALAQATSLEYDGQHNLTATVDPLGNRTTRTYDTAGRPIQQTDPGGRTTGLAYDLLSQLRAIGDAGGGTTRFSYDPNGNLLSVTDARGNSTSYVYNTMDRLTTRTDPLAHSETTSYDNNGNPTSFTDRKSQVTSTTYDGLDQPMLVTYQDGSTISYTWDAGNRVTQVVDSLGGTITRTYDGLDRLTSETTPEGSVSYTYDTNGRRTGMTVNGQPAITYAYDNADRLTSITQGAAVVTFAYDNADRRITLTLPSGVITSYAYDAASRLSGLTYTLNTTTLGTLLYGYDASDNRQVVGGTWARTNLPPLLEAATYNAANRQLTFGAQTLTYDLNGNLTSDGTSTYTWDARDRLTALAGPNPASFVYDGAGRRRARTIGGTTTNVLHDGLNPVQEQAGVSIRNLLTGLRVDEFLTRDDGAGTRGFLGDALGSTLALVDASGLVQATYTYDPFGTTSITGSPGANALSYTGREDDGTGLKYYRARYYHPGLQRFISADPIDQPAGGNLYVYVYNNPLASTDPLGLYTVGGGLGAGAGAGVGFGAAGSLSAQGGIAFNSDCVGVGGAVSGGAFVGGPTSGLTWAPGEGLRAETPSNPGPAANLIGGYMMGLGFSKIGPGISVSTARNFAQLAGPSETAQFTLVFVTIEISHSLDRQNPYYAMGLSGAFGLGLAAFKTATPAAGTFDAPLVGGGCRTKSQSKSSR
ncbi:MAG: hypothetical protein DMD87_03705 [Candidatus Rokuibacteriota bacterium]|nr:MAG: hypothetical protein DMD87_03705 [Candidatus Rokubacteria bacterium]